MSQPAYAVFLCLDKEGQTHWSKILAKTGFKSDWPAHITLSAFDKILDDAVDRIEKLAKDFASFSITFETIGKFMNDGNVYFLAPTPTFSLLNLQKAMDDIFLAADVHPYYRSGSWVPHCSIALPGDWPIISELIKSPPAIFSCQANEVSLVDLINRKTIHQLSLGQP